MKPTELVCGVAIIGAGMAGIGAARQLLEQGYSNFLIIEASNKPGGRVETVKVGDSIIDLGAQWMHGVDSELYNFASDHGITHPDTSEEGLGIYIREDGYIFDAILVNKVDKEVTSILEECEKFVDKEDYPESVGEFLKRRFKKFVAESEEDPNLLWQLYDWHIRFLLIDNACDHIESLSAKEWGKYMCLGGPAHVNLKGGYGALVDALISDIPKDKFMFETVVKKIDDSHRGVELQCEKELYIRARHVIITCSLGVLKREFDMLNFQLPTEIGDAIGGLGFGGIGKVFLLFEENWWKCDGYQMIWKHEFEDEDHWLRHISGFETVLEQPNMLVAWITDNGVREMEELSHLDAGMQCVDLLRKFLKRDDIPYPMKVFKSNWCSNPWIRGAYSHSTPESDRLGVTPSYLNRPIEFEGIPKVFFAGEAVNENQFSTTHGAYASGVRQAKYLHSHL